VAEWLYDIERVGLVTDASLDAVLRERGANGWELVQIMPILEGPEPASYRLIFKTQKPTIAGSSDM
jgi:hypothetical protein